MLGPNRWYGVLSLGAFAALTCVPSAASAAPHAIRARAGRPHRIARVVKSLPCAKAPVEVIAGAESAKFSLVKCDGAALPSGIDQLSILARPGTVPKPDSKTHGADLPAGIRRIDARLVERLETVADHFRKDGVAPKVVLVSGYRPRSTGSYHSTGRALDFRIEGVKNEELVSFCKTLPDTGCGYYPNGMFVHIDARNHGAGHVAWIDASRSGEPPRYVSAWPAPADADGAKLPPLPADEHSAIDSPEPPKVDKTSDARRFQ